MAPKSKKPSLMTKASCFTNLFICTIFNVLVAKGLPFQKLKKVDLTGKNAIVTGSNSGLGLAMAMHLASMNANVFLACRNLKKAGDAKEKIQKEYPDANVSLVELDTASLETIRKFVSDWSAEGKTIDILIHNAGVGGPPSQNKPYGPDGFEYLYFTNFLSNFIITFMLEKYLAPDARILFTSSPGIFFSEFTEDFTTDQVKDSMEKGYHYPNKQGPYNSMIYTHTKMMQLIFARTLNRKYRAEGKGIVANAFCPGFAASDFFEKETVNKADKKTDTIWYFLGRGVKRAIPAMEATKTGMFLVTDKGKRVTDTKAGWFWERMRPRTSKIDLMSDEMLTRMWQRWCADSEIQWSYLPKEQ